MPSNYLILCCPLLLLPSIFPSIRVFSNKSVLGIRWTKYWSFSFSISLSNEYSGLIPFIMDWLYLLAVQGTLKSLLQHHSSRASVLQCSAFFIVQLSHLYMTTGKTIALTRRTFVGKVISLLFNMLSVQVGHDFSPKEFSSVTQSCRTLCDPMDCSMPGLPVHHISSWSLPRLMSIESVMPSNNLIPFSSCFQPFPASGSFQMSQLFTSGGPSIGVSASTSVLPMNIQDWFPLGWTGWISLQSKGLSRVFSNTTVQKHQFFRTQHAL